mgnify:FL=1
MGGPEGGKLTGLTRVLYTDPKTLRKFKIFPAWNLKRLCYD